MKAKLVLISRSRFPQVDDWDDWLYEHDASDVICKKIHKLKEIQESGGELLLLQADISNLQQMTKVFDNTHSHFGELNGIIHTAGVSGGGVIQLKTRKMVENVFAPKLQGTLVLDQLVQDVTLDFMVLCSSLTSALTHFGQVDYCAVNAFQDYYAESCHKQGLPLFSIDWDGWKQVGMAVNSGAIVEAQEEGLTPEEGIEVFKRVVSSSYAQVLVSTVDLQQRIKQSLEPIPDHKPKQSVTHIKNNMSAAYVASENATQQVIIDLWQSVLGIDPIGIHDDFFELGGDSLVATQAAARLIEKFPDAGLSSNTILTAPSVAQLSAFIETARQKDSLATDESAANVLVMLQKGMKGKYPFFLIHPIGGHVYYYRDLAQALDMERPVYGIQAQGVDGKHQALTTVEEMAEQYLSAIRSIQPRGPYLLGGASFGGMIAFEIAQLLQGQDEDIALLAMMDTPSSGKLPPAMDNNIDIMLYLMNMGDEKLSVSRKELELMSEKEQLEFFLNHGKTASRLLPETTREQLSHYLQVFKVNLQAMFAYEPEPYNGNICYFLAQSRDRFNPAEPDAGWRELVKNKINVVAVKGDHISIMEQPNVNVIASHLNKIMIKL